MSENTIENIIRKATASILEFAQNSFYANKTFSDIVANTKETVNNLGCRLIETIFTVIEQSYDNTRNKHQIVIRNRNKSRNIMTEMGVVSLNHTLYYDKNDERYFFATDELLQIEKYSRIENGLQAKLVSDATMTSFGKASALSDGAVSRQTVFNLVKKLKTIEAPVQGKVKEIKDIYIEADEDHIHLNDGNPAEMKLVYVHEGRENTNERSILKNPHYFVSIDSDPDQIWNDVSDYILTNYRAHKSNVHLSGDGAPWIKAGIRIMPYVQYHLDKFHLHKAMINISNGSKSMQARLRHCVYKGAVQDVQSLVSGICTSQLESKRRREIIRSALYVQCNMPYISKETCCSAEGHVSHVLSARMSSRPMAWSREGAERIAKLRAYMFNKGDFKQLMQVGKMSKSENVYIPVHQNRAKNNWLTQWGTSEEETYVPTYSIPGIEKVSAGFSRILKNLTSY